MKNWLAKLRGAGSRPKPQEFLYPTKKNVLAFFCILQVMPAAIFFFAGPASPVAFWAKFEGVIVGLICAWPLKPDKEMTSADKAIELKWTNLMFSLGMGALAIPALVMFLLEDATPWTALNSFVIPVFAIVTVLCAVIRIQQGGFFSKHGAPVVARAEEEVLQEEEVLEVETEDPAGEASAPPKKKK